MNRVELWVTLAAMLACGFAAKASETQNYEIAVNDGYGLADCLVAGNECGQVVADAWCEAHGHGHALAFGPRDAVLSRATHISTVPEPYLITCGN